MNRTRNPVVTVSEHHKPLDHPGVYIALKLIYYIHCQVTPRQTSATPSPTVTDYHTCSHVNDHHQWGQCRGSKWAPGLFYYYYYYYLWWTLASTTNCVCHITCHHTNTFAHTTGGFETSRGARGAGCEAWAATRLEPRKYVFFFFLF